MTTLAIRMASLMSKVSFLELIEDLNIDTNELVAECSSQAAKSAGVSFATAEAQLEVRKLILKISLKKAELDGNIRSLISEGDERGLSEVGMSAEYDSKGNMKKPTEGAITNAILLNDGVQDMENALIEAQEYADKIKAISYAYADKGKQLKSIVDLVAVRAYGGVRPDMDFADLANSVGRAALGAQVDAEREERDGE
jgi:hypothetical protein